MHSRSKSVLVWGCDPALQRVFDLIKLIPPANITVFCRHTERCANVKDVAAKLQITHTVCGEQDSTGLGHHDAVLFAQSSSCLNSGCIKAKLDAEQLADRVFMVWESHGPSGKLLVTMKTSRTVEFHEKGVPAGDIFTRIYGSKLWGTAGGGTLQLHADMVVLRRVLRVVLTYMTCRLVSPASSGSGIGSEPNCTQFIRPKVVSVIQKYNIQSMVSAVYFPVLPLPVDIVLYGVRKPVGGPQATDL